MRKVILTESQIRSVIGKIINEQTKIVTGTQTNTEQKTFPTQNLGDKFGYGQIDSPQVKSSIEALKPQIDQFIKNSDASSFTINIMAGESQVTNPKGYETKGSLALARANTVKNYFTQLYPDLIKNGTLKIAVPTSVNQVKIGETPYGGAGSGDNKNPDKVKLYNQEQFVSFNISGAGSKTTKTETYKFLCDTKPYKSTGHYLPFNENYTKINQWNVGKGEGKVKLWVETYSMPDIIYFEYNGKTYGSNLFRGADEASYRFLIGTALRAKFGTNLPEHMAGNTIIPVDYNNQELLQALSNKEEGSMKSWGLNESFKNVYGPGSAVENQNIMQAFADYDRNFRPKKLLATLGPNFPWGYLTSKILPHYDKDIAVIDKIDGVDTINIINVAPNGATGWQVGLQCQ